MKNAAYTVFKKEMSRFFGDKRLAFSTILLPGLLIYVVYSILGVALTSYTSVDEEYIYSAVVENMPEMLTELFDKSSITITDADGSHTSEEYIAMLESGSLDLYVSFPDDFTQAVESYLDGNSVLYSTDAAPNVEIYYNSTITASSAAYTIFYSTLNSFEQCISNIFNVNYISDDEEDIYDVATDEETTGSVLSMILPLILMTLLYTGCVSLAPESIAGEKDRGTIASLLITPIKRGSIATGKICALAIIALLSGLSSSLGTILSMPSLMEMDGMGDYSFTQYYSFSDYAMLVLVMLSTVLLLVTLIAILSTLAKTTKEAQSYTAPLMIIIMVICVMSMYSDVSTSIAVYFIPVYNTAVCMTQLFSFSLSSAGFAITVLSNTMYSLLGIFVIERMFDSEKIMFSK